MYKASLGHHHAKVFALAIKAAILDGDREDMCGGCGWKRKNAGDDM